MHFDERGVVCEQRVKLYMLWVWVPVGTCESAQGIWNNMILARFMANVESQLLEKLKDP